MAATPTAAQLAAAIRAAARQAKGAVLRATAPSAARHVLLLSATQILAANGGAAPTAGPSAVKFTTLARQAGMSPSALAKFVVAANAARRALASADSALQTALKTAAAKPALVAALAAYQAALAAAATTLSAASSTPIAAPPIRVVGVNA
jgi:hypothetical protein